MRQVRKECSPLSLVIEPKQELHGDDDEGGGLHIIERDSRMSWAATCMKFWIHHSSALDQPAQQWMELNWNRTRGQNSQHHPGHDLCLWWAFEPITWQIAVNQVPQTEPDGMQQSLASDWRKSRKLKEWKQSLCLPVNGSVGRHALENRQNTEHILEPARGPAGVQFRPSSWPPLWRLMRLCPLCSSHLEVAHMHSHMERDLYSPTCNTPNQLSRTGQNSGKHSNVSPEEVTESQSFTAPDQSQVDQSKSLAHAHQTLAPPSTSWQVTDVFIRVGACRHNTGVVCGNNFNQSI